MRLKGGIADEQRLDHCNVPGDEKSEFQDLRIQYFDGNCDKGVGVFDELRFG